MTATRPLGNRSAANHWPDWLLAALTLAGIIHTAVYYRLNGFLPQPFIYDLSDPLMDLYSVAYWGYQNGPYSVWNSIYPPISFVFTRLLSSAHCYAIDAFVARDCDIGLRVMAIFAFVPINAALVYFNYRRMGVAAAGVRALVVGFGFPVLFAADRGNLIIPCFTFFCLAFGRLLNQERWRTVALALAINFKPYLLLTAAPAIAMRHWRWLIQLTMAGFTIYLVTYVLQQGGSPAELLYNLTAFSRETSVNYWERVYASTSFAPLIRFAKSDFPLLLHIDSNVLDFLINGATALMQLATIGVATVLLTSMRAGEQMDGRRLVAMMVTFLLVMSESSGGYAMMFVVYMVMYEPWSGWPNRIMLVCAYLLSIPSDYIVLPAFVQTVDSYWSNSTVVSEFGVAIGQILRPVLMMVIMYCQIAQNLLDGKSRRVTRNAATAGASSVSGRAA